MRLHLLVKEDGVEHADGGAVERESWRFERKDELRLRRGNKLSGNLRVIAGHEDAAREVLPGGHAVQPTHVVLHMLVSLLKVEKLIDTVELNALVVDKARNDGLEAKLC